MKKIILCLVILLFAAGNVWAEEFSFRGTKWGASKEDVKKTEKGKLKEDMGWALLFDAGKVSGMDAETLYAFTNDNRLAGAGYFFNPKNTATEKYIEDYNKIKASVTNKYGNPIVDNEYWDKDTSKKLYADSKGNAILMGNLRLHTEWETDDTVIIADISGGNFSVNIILSYENKALLDIFQKESAERDKAQDDELF